MTGALRRRVLQVHPTRRCNLACTHCYTESGPQATQSLPAGRLLGVVADAAALGYDYLAISGGEPLLYPDLRALVDAGHAAGMTVAVTTNGTLRLTDRLLPTLREVDVLAVSLDGTDRTHDEVRGRAAFRRTDRTLVGAQAAHLRWGAIFTLTQHNLVDLPWVVAYAAQRGASFVQVHPLGTIGRAATMMADAAPDEVELTAALAVAGVVSREHGLPVLVDVVQRSEVDGMSCDGSPYGTEDFAEQVPVLTVMPDGLTLPLHHAVAPELALGNVNETRLADLAAGWLARGAGAQLEQVQEATRAAVLATGTQVLSWADEVAATSRAGRLSAAGCSAGVGAPR